MAQAEAVQQRDIKVSVPADPVLLPHDLPQRHVHGREGRLPRQIVRVDAMDVVGALPLGIPLKQLARKPRGDQAVILDRRAGRQRAAAHRDGNGLIQIRFCPGGLGIEDDGALDAERMPRAPPARAVHFPQILQLQRSVRPGVRCRRLQGNYGQIFVLLGGGSQNRETPPAVRLPVLHLFEPGAIPGFVPGRPLQHVVENVNAVSASRVRIHIGLP